MADNTFSKLSDDVVLQIFFQLEDDPRYWARLSCVCRKFSSLISAVCCKSKCISTFPSISTDLLSLSSTSSPPPGGWASLYKIAVCCPGLRHSGVLLDNSDFGLDRELGPNEDYPRQQTPEKEQQQQPPPQSADCDDGWTLYDDLYYDTVYDNSESTTTPMETEIDNPATEITVANEAETKNNKVASRTLRSHLASGVWNLSREQGNKLLASRFRDDCLYICDWPGCVHIEEKRNYMLFRGVFKNFKRSRVWRTINDGDRSKIEINCAFCSCKETWDLHSSFCLKRGFGYHDDGEPVVRAYVCENGHVSGAWTDLPLYT